jgi:hypothetical protein
MAADDEVALNKYGRFLEPILEIAKEEHLESNRER